jgi:hypothetical protein
MTYAIGHTSETVLIRTSIADFWGIFNEGTGIKNCGGPSNFEAVWENEKISKIFPAPHQNSTNFSGF